MISEKQQQSNFYIIFFLSYIFLAIVNPHYGHDFDTLCWRIWATGIYKGGIENSYSLEYLNYNPFLLYILSFFVKIQGSVEEIERNIYTLKIIILLFDYLAIFLAARFLKSRNLNYFTVFFILFNIAYLYNTYIWGQVDSIHTTLIFISFLFLFNSKPILGIIFFVLAYNMKPHSIIFLPFILILLLPYINLKVFFRVLFFALLTQLVILLPFLLAGTVIKVWENNVWAFTHSSVLSMNAFNMWFLLMPNEYLRDVSNELIKYGISYRTWGTLLFLIFSLITLLPLLSYVLKLKERGDDFYKLFFLSVALITFNTFFFLTDMHERYIHPIILFSGIYALLSSDYLSYIFFSTGYFLNLEKVFQYLKLRNYETFIFNPQFIAVLYLIGFIVGIVRLYSLSKVHLKDLLNLSLYKNIFTKPSFIKQQ